MLSFQHVLGKLEVSFKNAFSALARSGKWATTFNSLNKCRPCRRLTAESWDGSVAWGLGPCSNSFGTGPEEMTALGNYGASPYPRECETCPVTYKMTLALNAETTACLPLLPKQKTVFSPCTLTERGDEMRKTDRLNEHYIILSLATAQNIAYSI